MYLNRVMLFGNLTRDPELRALPSGMNVCNFSIATNHPFKDRDGKKQEHTEFHNVVVFGRQADNVANHLHKGSSAYIEGRLQTRSWDKDGDTKYRTEVIAEHVQFGPRSDKRSDEEAAGTGEPAPRTAEVLPLGIEYPKEDFDPADIPF